MSMGSPLGYAMVVSITHWRPFDLLSRSKKKCYVKINQKVHATDLTVISFLDYEAQTNYEAQI